MEIEPHKFSLVLSYYVLSLITFQPSNFSFGTAEVFWSLLLPVSTIVFVVVILHVLSFYPAQVTQLAEYEGSCTFDVVGSSPTLRPI